LCARSPALSKPVAHRESPTPLGHRRFQNRSPTATLQHRSVTGTAKSGRPPQLSCTARSPSSHRTAPTETKDWVQAFTRVKATRTTAHSREETSTSTNTRHSHKLGNGVLVAVDSRDAGAVRSCCSRCAAGLQKAERNCELDSGHKRTKRNEERGKKRMEKNANSPLGSASTVHRTARQAQREARACGWGGGQDEGK
jgi:hypothetical protein